MERREGLLTLRFDARKFFLWEKVCTIFFYHDLDPSLDYTELEQMQSGFFEILRALG